ncbi:MAG: hypothetical protein JWO36_3657 [Myxococcales bacterium]|nr:hypothetical protein [Myxococcales bacterium]
MRSNMKLLTLTFLATAVLGCGNSTNNQTPDARTIHEVDAAIDAPAGPDCFTGTATTHDQLINACPDPGVTRIMKMPHLALLNPDGTLPPLP